MNGSVAKQSKSFVSFASYVVTPTARFLLGAVALPLPPPPPFHAGYRRYLDRSKESAWMNTYIPLPPDVVFGVLLLHIFCLVDIRAWT
jgi:hypothetical protein